MTNFVKVYDKNRHIVRLNVAQIVVMWTYEIGVETRMKMEDTLGNVYTSLQHPDDFEIELLKREQNDLHL